MLEMIDIGIEEAIAFRLGGKITEEEMTSGISMFKEKIAAGEKLIVYMEVISIGGAEFAAFVEKLKFFIDFGMSHFSKVAVVTEKKWLHKIVDLEGKIFRNVDIKGFLVEQQDKALEFLKS